jgi:hypothetical protein
METCPSCVSLRQQIAALRDVRERFNARRAAFAAAAKAAKVRGDEQDMSLSATSANDWQLAVDELDALRAPEASALTQPVKVEHVCGLQGYCPGPPHYDPICPACEARFKASAPTTEQE